jgi:hypothetical protein
MGTMAVFVIERLITLRKASWRARLIALPLVIEMYYDIVVQAVFVRSLYDSIRGTEANWVSTN